MQLKTVIEFIKNLDYITIEQGFDTNPTPGKELNILVHEKEEDENGLVLIKDYSNRLEDEVSYYEVFMENNQEGFIFIIL